MTESTHAVHTIEEVLEEIPQAGASKLYRVVTSYYFYALLIAVICAGIFGWLADQVTDHTVGGFNRSILLAIHARQTPTLDSLALHITWLGSTYGIATLGLLFTAAFLLMKRYVDLATMAAVLIGASLMVVTLKLVFHNPRPQVFPPLVQETNFSFPSGHSLTSFAIWGFFAWWMVSLQVRNLWRWLLGLLGILVAASVALSRLYLGVHWPTDVLAGLLLGFGWVALCATGNRWFTRHARRERREMLHQEWLARQNPTPSMPPV
ncbi:MAG TPA: phosphatase PAP2 family protein [Candidatus Kapabacteria bacterium]|jgi:undecaprenyl-diphosphatase